MIHSFALEVIFLVFLTYFQIVFRLKTIEGVSLLFLLLLLLYNLLFMFVQCLFVSYSPSFASFFSDIISNVGFFFYFFFSLLFLFFEFKPFIVRKSSVPIVRFVLIFLFKFCAKDPCH